MAHAAFGELCIYCPMAVPAERVSSLLKGVEVLFHVGVRAVMAGLAGGNGLASSKRYQLAISILAMVTMGAFQAGLMGTVGKKGWPGLFAAVKG